jgi:hypothetical protein
MSTKRPISIEFNALFGIDRATPPTLEDTLARLFTLREHLRQRSQKLSRWFLGGNTKEEALLYEAFDEIGPTTALLAVLKEKARQDDRLVISHGAGLWNGEDPPDAASLSLHVSLVESPSLLTFTSRSPDFLVHDNVLATTLQIVALWNPLFVSVGPDFYEPVFKNRPGAGWMLYLPRPLSIQQVPEAGELVPVMTADAKGMPRHTGTIIVSIEDGPFSDDNPAHVQRAHDIEIRLAGQDLLPRFGDPMPSG